MFGRINFTAADSFDVILGEPSGTIFGGGARVGLPLGGLFVDVGAWRFRGEGERVFVFEGQEFPLGIPVEITVTPLELSAGWQFRFRRAAEAASVRGRRLHVVRLQGDVGVCHRRRERRRALQRVSPGRRRRISRSRAGSASAAKSTWTTVPDAIGESGVSRGVRRNRSRRHDASGSRSRSGDDAVRAQGPDGGVAHSGRAA